MNSSSFLLLSIGFVLLIVQQHQAIGSQMDKAGDELESKMEMAASLFKSFRQGNGAGNNSSDKCEKCKTETKNFDDALVKNGANITKFLVDYVCPASPSGEEQKDCLQFVKQMTQVAEALHILLKDSNTFCQAAGACSTANGASQANLPAILFNYASLAQDFMKMKFGDSEGCAKCQALVHIIDAIISEYGNKLKGFLIQYVCPAFPQSQECVDFVNKNLATYLARIHEALKDPKAVCTQGGFC